MRIDVLVETLNSKSHSIQLRLDKQGKAIVNYLCQPNISSTKQHEMNESIAQKVQVYATHLFIGPSIDHENIE